MPDQSTEQSPHRPENKRFFHSHQESSAADLNDPGGNKSAEPEPAIFNPLLLAKENLIPPSAPTSSRSVFREYLLPALLLAISLLTTTAIGARYMQNFRDGMPTVVSESDLWPWPWLFQSTEHIGVERLNLARFNLGWPFSLTLLGILITHEFGHYFACRAHRIRCTLPLVLPAPTLSGTAGAVIQIRGRIPNRAALVDVGIYGPLAGYAASLLAVVTGLLLSHSQPADHVPALLEFGQPLTMRIAHAALAVFRPSAPTFSTALRHPILIAGWVGLFITALNLIPGGQLDGGHILYAISPRWHRISTRVLPFFLIACGFFFWVGWILWGVILWIPAMRHPKVPDEQSLDLKRVLLALSALVMFVLALTPAPFAGSSILHYLR